MMQKKKSGGRSTHHGRGNKVATYESRLARDEIPRSLPSVQDQLTQRIILRFVTTTGFGGVAAVSWVNLLDAWYLAGTATNAYQLFDFVRIKKVTIRGMGGQRLLASGQIGAPPCATVAIEFPGLTSGQQGGGRQKADTQIGTTEPAMVSLKPDRASQAAQFQANQSTTAFYYRSQDQDRNGLSGTILDIELVYRNSADVSPATIATARSGMTAGTIYFNGLDGLTDAATAARSAFYPRI